MDEIKYKLNDKYVIRSDDKCLFNAHSFRIYKFNSTGYKIISHFVDAPASVQCISNNMDLADEEVTKFVEKCLSHQILVQV